MNRRKQGLGLALACLVLCSLVGRVSAQDALGPGADFSDDDWDAILKLAPPPAGHGSARSATAASADPRRKSRGDELDPTKEEKRQRSRERAEDGTLRERASRDESTAARASDTRRPSERSAREERRGRRAKDEALEVPGFAPGGYEGLARSWHEPWPDDVAQQLATKAGAAPALSLHPVGGKAQTPYVLIPKSADGGFDDLQIDVASKALNSWDGGPRVSARLLDLIYHAAKHFDVFHVHVVSGVRRDRSGSRHSHGLAADIVLPGVSDEELAAYFRPQGFCGVGIYTRAGFVHIDVRERSYFWLDKSPPGRRMKIIPVRGEEARAADEAALARGQSGYVNPPRLQKALHARNKRRWAQAKISQ